MSDSNYSNNKPNANTQRLLSNLRKNQEERNRRRINMNRMRREMIEYERSRKSEQNRIKNAENRLFLSELKQWMENPIYATGNADALQDFINKINAESDSAFSKGIYRHYITPIDDILGIDLLSFLNSYKDYSINLLYHLHLVYENFKKHRQLNTYRENMFIESMNNYYLMVENEKKTLKNSAELIYQALQAFKCLTDLIGIRYQSFQSSPNTSNRTGSSNNGSRSGSPVEGGYSRKISKTLIKEDKIKKIKAYIKKIMELVESM